MDFARKKRGFCVGFAWNLIHFSFMREREGYKHHADSTVRLYWNEAGTRDPNVNQRTNGHVNAEI